MLSQLSSVSYLAASKRSLHTARMDMGKRIRQARTERNLSAEKLGEELGVSRAAVSQWEAGGTITVDNLFGLAEKLDISLDWLAFGKGAANDNRDFVGVHQYDVRASAGGGSLVTDESRKSLIMFRRDWLSTVSSAPAANLAMIKAEGSSMAPTINDGDDLLIDLTQIDPKKEGIYVIRWDDALNVKRLTTDPIRKEITISSDNPAAPKLRPVKYHEIAVLGRVIWIGRRV
jgi:phage repressor protein C with HTH and peptisase S24 domain